MPTDRRAFIQYLSSAALTAALPNSVARAAAIAANNRTGTIEDVEHIVFLMQENRAFDHYFGTLRGVRGYGDPRPVSLPSGDPVWHQPDGGGVLLPFHPTAPDLGLAFLEDTPHGWGDTHAAWNGGNYDQWVPNKGRSTMAHLTRKDIPFHYALADAFTICDAYHCSLLGPTDPNRYHMWTGWVGNDGKGGGPVINNAEEGYDWSTYPERLEKAGISWKIYQDQGVGLDGPGFWGWTSDPYIGNYGDNSLLYFHQYQNAVPGDPLYDKARTGTNIAVSGGLFDVLRADVSQNKLPQVSWIVAPEAFSEHGNWPANYGAWYISQVLDALTSNPRLFSKTVLFLTYDENDGFFDHVVPPTPPRSASEGKSTVDASDEIFAGSPGNESGPYGLGIRVPMIIISPWTKGGWVCSEVFDHTSLIRFLEQRFAHRNPKLLERNITRWRRTVCGDLTSAFDFSTPDYARVALPDTSAYEPPDNDRHDDYVPTPPTNQSVPRQEHGLRRARALPYALRVDGQADLARHSFGIQFSNDGKAGACFQVRSGNGSEGPWTYTVEAGKALSDSWDVSGAADRRYDLSVFGPNGFLRVFRGKASPAAQANLDVRCSYDASDLEIILVVTNRGPHRSDVTATNAYGGDSISRLLDPGDSKRWRFPVKGSHGWYDISITASGDDGFLRRVAGHLEDGKDSASDPAFGHDGHLHSTVATEESVLG
jgi:phospholipase C